MVLDNVPLNSSQIMGFLELDAVIESSGPSEKLFLFRKHAIQSGNGILEHTVQFMHIIIPF